MRKYMRLAAAVALGGSLLGTPPAARAQDLAIVGGTVIPASGAPPIPDAVVLVRNGRIAAIGAMEDFPDLPTESRIDAAGKWITPGLIDTNVHLILLTIPEFYVKYEDRLVDIAIQSAQVGLKYGMTTMADSWGPLDPLLEARSMLDSGEVEGSRVLIAGNIVGMGGPFGPYMMGGWDIRGPSMRYGGWVHPEIQGRINRLWESGMGPELLAMTPEEVAGAMRSYIARGVDFVKVAVSGHGIGPVEPLMFSDEVLRAMRDEAAAAGIHFQTHTFSVPSLRQALEMGPELMQHPNVMSVGWLSASPAQRSATRELAKKTADMGVYAALMAIPEKRQMQIYAEWDPSEHPGETWLNNIMMNRKPAFVGATYEDRVAGLRVWLDSGVRFTLATDQGPDSRDLGPVVWGRLGRAHFDRMQGFQDAGVPPMDILVAATRNGADAYGLGDELGTVEVGKVADLLVLDADPLADIANIRKIVAVIKGGRIVDRDALPTVKVLDYDPELPWPY